jgi:hypothetical protein
LCHGNHDPAGEKIATGLGWFSIGLGLLELGATRSLARWLGMDNHERLLQSYGVREITAGIGILGAKDPTPWVWARVLGDALDLGTLAAYYTDDNDEQENVGMAILNVALVTALDVYCGLKLSRQVQPAATADYSDRSGFPQSPQAMRGAAGDAMGTKAAHAYSTGQ